MLFKPAPRSSVVSISEDQARFARGTEETELDKKHNAAMERAKKIDDPDAGEVMGLKDVPALYKIEVFFGPNRTANGPNSCTMKFWESGRRLHGGGDDLMFMCSNSAKPSEGCGKIFSSDLVRAGVAICPGCHKALNAEKCTRGLVFRDESERGGPDYRIETKKLATLVTKYWHRLGGNADIYCKYDRTDIRYRMAEKDLGPQRAKELRGLSIYPLRHILSDTAGGAELEKRIFAFLTA